MTRLLTLILLGGLALAQTTSPQATMPPATSVSGKQQSASEATELLPDLPPLPQGNATLIGGTISDLDRVRDQVTVKVFGGRDIRALFDERTLVYRDSLKASQRDLRPGQRAYLDTVLDQGVVFARSIYVLTQTPTGESRGQVVTYQPGNGELLLRDPLSSVPVKLHVSVSTVILSGERAVSAAELRPGSLVAVEFRPSGDGQVTARKISLLAEPGTAVTFAGRVTHLDLHTGLLVLVDPRDKRTYEVHLDPATVGVSPDLREGVDVTVVTGFDGRRYIASTLMVNSPSGK